MAKRHTAMVRLRFVGHRYVVFLVARRNPRDTVCIRLKPVQIVSLSETHL